jgi:hypothetical protein
VPNNALHCCDRSRTIDILIAECTAWRVILSGAKNLSGSTPSSRPRTKST